MTGDVLRIGEWTAERLTGRISRADEVRTLEPKVMDLLFLLASRPGEVFTREELFGSLWRDMIVGDDALARCIFKLRRALGDDPRQPTYVETVAKRGYRLLQVSAAAPAEAPRRRHRYAIAAAVAATIIGAPILLLSEPAAARQEQILQRADDSYFQFTLGDNQAALELYRQALAEEPDSPRALAGLSSALVQQLIRWPDGQNQPRPEGSALRAALASGQLRTEAAREGLSRARALAERALALRPHDAWVLRALGLVLSAQGELGQAASAYDRALALEPGNWGVLMNRADLLEMNGEAGAALVLLERAYGSMERDYRAAPVRIRPWQAALGTAIARRHARRGDLRDAEAWYQRTLSDMPAAEPAASELRALRQKRGGASPARGS